MNLKCRGLKQRSGERMVDEMPLTMAGHGEVNRIKKIGGKEETNKFLETLGFVVGSDVRIISETGGNLIVSVKDSRVALSKELASRIIV